MQERKEEGAKGGDAEVPVEAQDLTVFVQSVMEQMVCVREMSSCTMIQSIGIDTEYRYQYYTVASSSATIVDAPTSVVLAVVLLSAACWALPDCTHVRYPCSRVGVLFELTRVIVQGFCALCCVHSSIIQVSY